MKRKYYIAIVVSSLAQMLTSQHAYAQAVGKTASVDTIIVTARRVEERLQDVPISVSVVGQDRITSANVVSGEDLVKVIPGLNVQSRYSAENATFSIRGFSQELQTSASVGAYFAEVVSPRSGGTTVQGEGAGPGSLFDLQSVQVLKGPQGTLFGRNTTGGAVLLTPRKPVDHFEGYVEGSYGNYDMKRVQAVINGPLAPWARLRIGIDRLKRDGYVNNVSGIGPRHFYDADYVALRGSLVLDLKPNLENYTIASYLHSDTNGQVAQLFRANPILAFGALGVAQVDRLNASGDKYQVEQKLSNPRSLTKQFQVIDIATWKVSDDLTVKNIASFSTYKQILRQDLYGTNFLIPNTLTPFAYISTAFLFNGDIVRSADQKNFTEELQLQGDGLDHRFNYQTGLYYEHSTPGGLSGAKLPSVGTICQIGPFETIADIHCLPPGLLTGAGTLTTATGSLEFTNMAAYAQGTYALTDQLKLTGGVRYTYDRSNGVGTGLNYTFVSATPGTFGSAVLTGCQPTFAQYANCTQFPKTSSKRPTWTLNATYNPTSDLMVYGSYSRGYRQGAAAPFFAGGNSTFAPEKTDNFEAGSKFSFQGDLSGYLNAAVYYSKLKNQQLLVGAVSTTNGNTATSIYNAGKSRVYGLDLDGSVRFSSLFRVDSSLTYVNSKLITFNVPAAIPGYDVILPSALAGDPLPFTPKWGLNTTGTFTLPTSDDVGRVDLSVTYRYNSAYATAASSVSNIKATAVSQVDMNIDWHNVGGSPVDISLFASNITNQFTTTTITPLFDSFGFDTRYLGRPRMFGVRTRWRFGEG
jgi:iron complex outermembrane receptor protein